MNIQLILQKLDPDSTRIIMNANARASRLGHNFISPEHVLLALLESGNESLNRLFWKAKINPDIALKELTTRIADEVWLANAQREAVHDFGIQMKDSTKEALESAFAESHNSQQTEITPQHLLVGCNQKNFSDQLYSKVGAIREMI